MQITLSASIEKESGSLNIDVSANPFPSTPARKNKGKSIIAFPDTYCVIDIETTGLSPAYDNIIEISAIKISSDHIIDTFSSLVQPFSTSNKYIDEYITKLTGITNEMLSSAPKEEEVIPIFKTFIGSSILIGHNVNFDINFLYDSFETYLNIPLTNDFVDTMRIARKLHKELSHHRLSDIASLYNIDYSSAHRALKDCEIANSCYIHLKNEILSKYSTLDAFTKNVHYKIKSKDVQATTDEFDDTNMLYQKVIVFTGTLEKMTRKEAMQIVVNLGGINNDNITKKTNYLVLGNNDYCSQIKDGKSNKQKKAEQLKLAGYDISIIPEDVFYDMIAEENPVIDKQLAPLEAINESDKKFYDELQFVLDEIISSYDLPKKSIHIYSNKSVKGENVGKETSRSICIYEPDYPETKDEIDNPGKNFVVMNIQNNNDIELLIRNSQYNAIDLPNTATVKPVSSDTSFKHIIFTYNDDTIYDYIKSNIIHCLKTYHSNARSFGCCSHFIECSDAMKCVHENKLYSTACSYRKNLEDGKIFYGKNRNIDK